MESPAGKPHLRERWRIDPMRQIAVQSNLIELLLEGVLMPQVETRRAARLEARVSPAMKRRLEYAASLRGTTLTEFVIQSAHEAASRAIRENEVLTLSERARKNFVQLLLNPPRPNRKALAAAKRY
jgi:uncharacterized protein (DUF1778 family)